jgi:hypothetical protein
VIAPGTGPPGATCPIVRDPSPSCRGRITRLASLALALISLLVSPSRAAAQYGDDQVKAAFLLNFLKFVTWPDAPATPAAPIAVVVVGNEDLARALGQAAAGQAIGGRPVIVRAVRPSRDIGPTPHLLYIGASERDRLPVLLRQCEGKAVLTVGDGTGYGAAGVVLNFYVSDTRIRFEANTTAAARAGLQISSHLLRLARIVG